MDHYEEAIARVREGNKHLQGLSVGIALMTIVIGLLTSAFPGLLKLYHQRVQHPLTIEERIEELTTSLGQPVTTISEIEKEVRDRQALVERLQRDAEVAEDLIAVSQEQINAVAQTLRGELERQERSSFWWGVGMNFLFIVIGVTLTELYHFTLRRIRRAGAAEESPA